MAGRDWAETTAPSLDEFEQIAAAAYGSLPQAFLDLIDGVPFSIDDFPSDDVLAEFDMESPFELLGLFEGRGLIERGMMPETGEMPNRIRLYRRPILDYWAEHEGLTLGEIVVHVLVHEIGHHFGFSDEDMERIEAEAAAEEEGKPG